MLCGCFFGQSARDFIKPIDQLGVATTTLDQAVQSVTAIASALVASHAQQVELADQISEDDRAIAGALWFRAVGCP